MTTILLAGGGTGGHLMPALAIARAIGERHPDWRCVFAGAERGVEARVLPERGVPHQLFPFQPIHRHRPWRNLAWPFRIRRLISAIDAMLDRESPDAVIGTGGYVSGPVVFRAASRGIPTGIIELDVRPGIATRWLAGRAREIWLAVPESLDGLPVNARSRARVTGAPIVAPDSARRDAAMLQYGFRGDRPVVVVTGGSQGARAINELVAEWLRAGGADHADIIWGTGATTHHTFAHLHRPPHVHVVPFIDPMAAAWSVADLCVARAGMMTIAELCAWGIPSILIPLPSAAADHQTHNARALAAVGAAVWLPQAGLSAEQLGEELRALLDDAERRRRMADAARARGRPGAAAEIAERVDVLVGA
ncbi:MAG: undecaprenyldiphospho-muramoylpentapeptide beta-N-acetylglucosaminyltransferase [Gemmatimonadales bacterium]|nr:undecaprenyldiphospho-muramoylpentapeptide beta-N-acetylglucosaminyltransferase [Gemmatimonadales bacterium]